MQFIVGAEHVSLRSHWIDDPDPHRPPAPERGESEIRGPASGAEILASQKARVTRICPIRASIALPERNHMSQTRKTMSLTFENANLSSVRNMSHSGLTGLTIPTPNGLQHLNGGKSEIRGPASGAEILAGQKARVTRICPLQASIALPGRNHMSQTRKTRSLTSKNFRLSPVQNMSHSGPTGLTIPTPNGLQHLNEGKSEIRGPASGTEILAGQKVRVTREIKEWLEQQIGSMSDRKNDLADIKREISLFRQTVDAMHKKIDSIEHILEKVSG